MYAYISTIKNVVSAPNVVIAEAESQLQTFKTAPVSVVVTISSECSPRGAINDHCPVPAGVALI